MKYSLEITQYSDGETTRIEEPAEGRFYGGALELSYVFDGSLYKLTIEEDKIAQMRTGAFKIDTVFLRGQKTVCRISDGNSGGEFDIFTKSLKVDFNGLNASAECEFSYEKGGDTTVLCITATVVQ